MVLHCRRLNKHNHIPKYIYILKLYVYVAGNTHYIAHLWLWWIWARELPRVKCGQCARLCSSSSCFKFVKNDNRLKRFYMYIYIYDKPQEINKRLYCVWYLYYPGLINWCRNGTFITEIIVGDFLKKGPHVFAKDTEHFKRSVSWSFQSDRHHGVSSHRPLNSLLDSLVRLITKKHESSVFLPFNFDKRNLPLTGQRTGNMRSLSISCKRVKLAESFPDECHRNKMYTHIK